MHMLIVVNKAPEWYFSLDKGMLTTWCLHYYAQYLLTFNYLKV